MRKKGVGGGVGCGVGFGYGFGAGSFYHPWLQLIALCVISYSVTLVFPSDISGLRSPSTLLSTHRLVCKLPLGCFDGQHANGSCDVFGTRVQA
jgi:hypothetical protein